MSRILFITFFLLTHNVFAQDLTFEGWKQQFTIKALESGISQDLVTRSLNDLTPNDKVIRLDGKQPEKTITFEEYRKRIVSPTRLKKGREMMRKHKDILSKVSKDYGVPAQYIVALWGTETNFGGYTGNFNTVRSLASLAWEGRRRAFFEGELINALKIIQEGHISADNMIGSWAGALGQNQFMPSSFLAYAQDYNGNGRKNIWSELEDVFASTANYLKRSGWIEDQRWGREVKVPKSITKDMVSRKIKHPLSYWRDRGVTLPNGNTIPVVGGIQASLVAPDGLSGKTYLIYNNYNVLMKWNRSTYFATSVSLLADKIK